jgi:hypothetical protein
MASRSDAVRDETLRDEPDGVQHHQMATRSGMSMLLQLNN